MIWNEMVISHVLVIFIHLKKLVSIAVLFSIVFATLGLDIGMHLCGGEIKSIALFSEAEPCAHAIRAEAEKNLPPCHRHHSDDQDEEKGCCEDVYNESEIIDIQVIPDQSQWEPILLVDFIAIVPADLPEFKSFEYVNPEYLNYKPPLISTELGVLYQRFLI